MNSERKEYSFLWLIENYSYCELNWGEDLVSPDFTPQGLGGTSWTLCLNPEKLRYGYYYSLYLRRSAHDAGPQEYSLKFEISIITVFGSTLYSEECEHPFRNRDQRQFKPLFIMDKLYIGRNTEYLPRDTLGVRCRVWKGEGSVHNVMQCSARTRIGIEKISFLHRVENFSTLQPEHKNILQIPSHSKKECVCTSTLHVVDRSISKESVTVEIVPFNSNYKLFKKKISLIDVSGNTIECGEVDYRFFNFEMENDIMYKSLTRQIIMDKSKEYLPNDELSLLCECTFSTGVELVKIEEILNDIPVITYKNIFYNAQSKTVENFTAVPSASEDTKKNHNDQHLMNVDLKANIFYTNINAPSRRHSVTYNQMKNNDMHKDKYNAAEKLSTCPSVQDDFKTLYNDQLLTDIVLKTSTKSFPAHKNVLCARSSVFRAMLTSDMKEKNTECINVEDLENETVQRLLLFLYSDNLEELQWRSAIQLYYAGDKYAIEKLKVLCSSFLVENLNTSTAIELLLLADTHSDTELKKFVEDFILEHEQEVFGSDEWDKLSETNPQLVIKTMKLKYKREKGGK